MSFRRREHRAIDEKLVERYVIPTKDFQGAEVVDHRKGIKLVHARYDAMILDICQTTDVHDEFRPTSAGSQLKAGTLDVAISQTEPLADLPQTESREHSVL